jgi:8-oxo-dGTP diphosphatase
VQAIGVAVDVTVFTVERDQLAVLLVKLRKAPFEGAWALPGGLIGQEETVEAAAVRELAEKTGLRDVYLEQLYTFSDPERDPNGRCISVAHLALVPAEQAQLSATTKYAGVGFFPVAELPPLAYDHPRILTYALERLRAKLQYTNVAYSLLPESFTLSELQRVYEIVLGRPLDTRNFRKRILDLELVEPTEGLRRGPFRPAQLYRFTTREPTILRMSI